MNSTKERWTCSTVQVKSQVKAALICIFFIIMENYLLNSSKSLFEFDFYVISDLLLKVTLLYAE